MYDITIQLRTDSEVCLYQQIYEHIRQEIREGRLLAGERLPSTRSLAEFLQVSRSTVDYAYDQLLGEGYIESKPYRGYFVCPLEDVFELQAAQVPVEPWEKENREDEESSSGGECIYDFSPHGLQMKDFPFSVWKKLTKKVLNEGNQELFAQGMPQGDRELRETICRYLHSSRGVNCSPHQIIVGAGTDYLLLLLEKILGPGRCVGMDNPTYKRAYRIFASMGYRLPPIAMDAHGMTPQGLREAGVDVAYVMPSHQYPSGKVMPVSRRNQLLSWAGETADRFLIEDDYDSEFRYHGKPIPSLQAADEQGKVIYMGTFSKAIAPAIRVGYMVLPQVLWEKYRESCFFYSCTVSRIDQRILNEFIRDGYFERYLNKMRKVYRAKHQLLLEELRDFGTFFEISGENAGLHLVLTPRNGRSEEELLRRAGEQGVRVYGMAENMVAETKRKPSVLIGFGGLSNQAITEGVDRLRKAWLS